MELDPPDRHYLNAAEGWLDLGNSLEARAELDRIPEANRRHPEVLRTLWRICANEKRWKDAVETARELIRVDPDDPSGWIHQSYSLHELKLTREAYDRLKQVQSRFTEISTIPYNLACYACQLGELEQTRTWLAQAIRIRGKDEIKNVALADPDLQPVWEELKVL